MYLGIDPGKSGGIAIVNNRGEVVSSTKMPDTDKDTMDYVFGFCEGADFAMIEKVSASPQMGVVSAFTFGRSYGFLIGALTGSGIPFEFVTPQKWQKAMGCMTKGDKNVSKAAAQRLFPDVKMTHAIADALLIAEYCRRVRH